MDTKSTLKKRQHKLGLRATAMAVAMIFTATGVTWPAPLNPGMPQAPQPAVDFPGSALLTVPPEAGQIEFQRDFPGAGKKVVLIQDAHAILDAQVNIQKLIEYLSERFGFRLVALEGAKSELDPTLFRNFPDPFVKKRVLAGYLDRGELTGPQMAAVFPETGKEDILFQGIEDWRLYEDNYWSYLRAQKNKRRLLEKWNELRSKTDADRKAVYSEKLNEFHEQCENFRLERTSFVEFLMYLVNFKKMLNQEGFPELNRLLDSVGYAASGRQETLDPMIKAMAAEFKKKFARELGVKEEMNFYNRYQQFLTGKMEGGKFLQYMIELGNSKGFRPKLTPQMKVLLGHTETMASIKGGKLYLELEKAQEVIEASLITKKEERPVVEKYRQLLILKDLINLEMTHEQLAKYQESPETYLALIGGQDFRSELMPALEFYRFALERDQAFYKNLMKLMEKQTTSHGPRATGQALSSQPSALGTAIVVAGGFHTEGLKRLLEDQKISYAVVSPKMASVKGQENYEKVMENDVSYKEFLRTTYYDAFVRHSTQHFVNELNQQDFRKDLKAWRDEVIRDLARQGRVAEAGKYTFYIDILARIYAEKFGPGAPKTKDEVLKIIQKELNSFRDQSLAAIWQRFESQLGQFTAGLKELISKKQLTTDNVATLLSGISKGRPSMLAAPASVPLDPTNEIIPEEAPGIPAEAAQVFATRPEIRDVLNQMAGQVPAGIPGPAVALTAGQLARGGEAAERLVARGEVRTPGPEVTGAAVAGLVRDLTPVGQPQAQTAADLAAAMKPVTPIASEIAGTEAARPGLEAVARVPAEELPVAEKAAGPLAPALPIAGRAETRDQKAETLRQKLGGMVDSVRRRIDGDYEIQKIVGEIQSLARFLPPAMEAEEAKVESPALATTSIAALESYLDNIKSAKDPAVIAANARQALSAWLVNDFWETDRSTASMYLNSFYEALEKAMEKFEPGSEAKRLIRRHWGVFMSLSVRLPLHQNEKRSGPLDPIRRKISDSLRRSVNEGDSSIRDEAVEVIKEYRNAVISGQVMPTLWERYEIALSTDVFDFENELNAIYAELDGWMEKNANLQDQIGREDAGKRLHGQIRLLAATVLRRGIPLHENVLVAIEQALVSSDLSFEEQRALGILSQFPRSDSALAKTTERALADLLIRSNDEGASAVEPDLVSLLRKVVNTVAAGEGQLTEDDGLRIRAIVRLFGESTTVIELANQIRELTRHGLLRGTDAVSRSEARTGVAAEQSASERILRMGQTTAEGRVVRYPLKNGTMAAVTGILDEMGEAARPILENPNLLAKIALVYESSKPGENVAAVQKWVANYNAAQTETLTDEDIAKRPATTVPRMNWSGFFDFGGSLLSGLKKAIASGLEYYEGSFESAAFIPNRLLGGEYSKGQIRAVREAVQKSGIKLTIHSPIIGPNQFFEDPVDNLDIMKEQIRVAGEMGAVGMVFHLMIPETMTPERIDQLAGLVLYARQNAPGLKVNFENSYNKAKKFPTAGVFMKAFAAVFERVREQDPAALANIGIVFDVAHYNLSGEDPVVSAYVVASKLRELVDAHPELGLNARDFLEELHLNQNLGPMEFYLGFSADLHSPVSSEGPINNRAVITLFALLGFDPIVTVEQMPVLSPEDIAFIRDAQSAAQTIRLRVAVDRQGELDSVNSQGAAILSALRRYAPVYSDAANSDRMNAYQLAAGLMGQAAFADHMQRRVFQSLFAIRSEEDFIVLKQQGLAPGVNIGRFDPDTPILKQGTIPDEEVNSPIFYLLIKGKVRGNVKDAAGKVVNEFTIPAGRFFGEKAFLEGEGRSASVLADADGETVTLTFTRGVVEIMEKKMPDFRKHLRQINEKRKEENLAAAQAMKKQDALPGVPAAGRVDAQTAAPAARSEIRSVSDLRAQVQVLKDARTLPERALSNEEQELLDKLWAVLIRSTSIFENQSEIDMILTQLKKFEYTAFSWRWHEAAADRDTESLRLRNQIDRYLETLDLPNSEVIQSNLYELAGNIRRHTRSDAIILIRHLPGTKPEEKRIEMIVIDKGRGLVPENLAAPDEGYATGLTMVQRAPDFKAESVPGSGSRVTIALPREGWVPRQRPEFPVRFGRNFAGEVREVANDVESKEKEVWKVVYDRLKKYETEGVTSGEKLTGIIKELNLDEWRIGVSGLVSLRLLFRAFQGIELIALVERRLGTDAINRRAEADSGRGLLDPADPAERDEIEGIERILYDESGPGWIVPEDFDTLTGVIFSLAGFINNEKTGLAELFMRNSAFRDFLKLQHRRIGGASAAVRKIERALALTRKLNGQNDLRRANILLLGNTSRAGEVTYLTMWEETKRKLMALIQREVTKEQPSYASIMLAYDLVADAAFRLEIKPHLERFIARETARDQPEYFFIAEAYHYVREESFQRGVQGALRAWAETQFEKGNGEGVKGAANWIEEYEREMGWPGDLSRLLQKIISEHAIPPEPLSSAASQGGTSRSEMRGVWGQSLVRARNLALVGMLMLAPMAAEAASKAEVTRVQQALVELGLLTEADVDGVYGPLTAAAVREFQRTVGIQVDGKWGKDTEGKYRSVTQPAVEATEPSTAPVTPTPAAGQQPGRTMLIVTKKALPDLPPVPNAFDAAKPMSPANKKSLESLGIAHHQEIFRKLSDGAGKYGVPLMGDNVVDELVSISFANYLLAVDIGSFRIGAAANESGPELAAQQQKGGPAETIEMIEPRSALYALLYAKAQYAKATKAGDWKEVEALGKALYDGLPKDRAAFITKLARGDPDSSRVQNDLRKMLREDMRKGDFDLSNRLIMLYLFQRLTQDNLSVPEMWNLVEQARTYVRTWAPGLWEYPRVLAMFLFGNMDHQLQTKVARGETLSPDDSSVMREIKEFTNRIVSISTHMRRAAKAVRADKKNWDFARMEMDKAQQETRTLQRDQSNYRLIPEGIRMLLVQETVWTFNERMGQLKDEQSLQPKAYTFTTPAQIRALPKPAQGQNPWYDQRVRIRQQQQRSRSETRATAVPEGVEKRVADFYNSALGSSGVGSRLKGLAVSRGALQRMLEELFSGVEEGIEQTRISNLSKPDVWNVDLNDSDVQEQIRILAKATADEVFGKPLFERMTNATGRAMLALLGFGFGMMVGLWDVTRYFISNFDWKLTMAAAASAVHSFYGGEPYENELRRDFGMDSTILLNRLQKPATETVNEEIGRSEMRRTSAASGVAGVSSNLTGIRNFYAGFRASPTRFNWGRTIVLSLSALSSAHRDRVVSRIMDFKAQDLPPGRRENPELLSIGPGLGQVEKELVQRGIKVDAIELAPNFVRELTAAGIPTREGNAMDVLPQVPSQSRDMIYISGTLGYLDVEKVLVESRRILRPGGLLMIEDSWFVAEPRSIPQIAGYVAYPTEYLITEAQASGFGIAANQTINLKEFSPLTLFFWLALQGAIQNGFKTGRLDLSRMIVAQNPMNQDAVQQQISALRSDLRVNEALVNANLDLTAGVDELGNGVFSVHMTKMKNGDSAMTALDVRNPAGFTVSRDESGEYFIPIRHFKDGNPETLTLPFAVGQLNSLEDFRGKYPDLAVTVGAVRSETRLESTSPAVSAGVAPGLRQEVLQGKGLDVAVDKGWDVFRLTAASVTHAELIGAQQDVITARESWVDRIISRVTGALKMDKASIRAENEAAARRLAELKKDYLRRYPKTDQSEFSYAYHPSVDKAMLTGRDVEKPGRLTRIYVTVRSSRAPEAYDALCQQLIEKGVAKDVMAALFDQMYSDHMDERLITDGIIIYAYGDSAELFTKISQAIRDAYRKNPQAFDLGVSDRAYARRWTLAGLLFPLSNYPLTSMVEIEAAYRGGVSWNHDLRVEALQDATNGAWLPFFNKFIPINTPEKEMQYIEWIRGTMSQWSADRPVPLETLPQRNKHLPALLLNTDELSDEIARERWELYEGPNSSIQKIQPEESVEAYFKRMEDAHNVRITVLSYEEFRAKEMALGREAERQRRKTSFLPFGEYDTERREAFVYCLPSTAGVAEDAMRIRNGIAEARGYRAIAMRPESRAETRAKDPFDASQGALRMTKDNLGQFETGMIVRVRRWSRDAKGKGFNAQPFRDDFYEIVSVEGQSIKMSRQYGQSSVQAAPDNWAKDPTRNFYEEIVYYPGLSQVLGFDPADEEKLKREVLSMPMDRLFVTARAQRGRPAARAEIRSEGVWDSADVARFRIGKDQKYEFRVRYDPARGKLVIRVPMDDQGKPAITEGEEAEKEFDFKPGTVINIGRGRSADNQILIRDIPEARSVSRAQSAVIIGLDGKMYIQDRVSSQGTWYANQHLINWNSRYPMDEVTAFAEKWGSNDVERIEAGGYVFLVRYDPATRKIVVLVPPGLAAQREYSFEFRKGREINIGRGGWRTRNDIALSPEAERVSRQHFRIGIDILDRVYVQDRGSGNGTGYNGQVIRPGQGKESPRFYLTRLNNFYDDQKIEREDREREEEGPGRFEPLDDADVRTDGLIADVRTYGSEEIDYLNLLTSIRNGGAVVQVRIRADGSGYEVFYDEKSPQRFFDPTISQDVIDEYVRVLNRVLASETEYGVQGIGALLAQEGNAAKYLDYFNLSDFARDVAHRKYERGDPDNYFPRADEFFKDYLGRILDGRKPLTGDKVPRKARSRKALIEELRRKDPAAKAVLLSEVVGKDPRDFRVVLSTEATEAEWQNPDVMILHNVMYELPAWRRTGDEQKYTARGERVVFARWKGQVWMFYTSRSHKLVEAESADREAEQAPVHQWRNCDIFNFISGHRQFVKNSVSENLDDVPGALSALLDQAMYQAEKAGKVTVKNDNAAPDDLAKFMGFDTPPFNSVILGEADFPPLRYQAPKLARAPARAEIRLGDLLEVDAAQVAREVNEKGEEPVRSAFLKQGGKELEGIRAAYDEGANAIRADLLKQADLIAFVGTPEMLDLLRARFGDRVVALMDMGQLQEQLVSAIMLPAAFADEPAGFIVAKGAVDYDRVAQDRQKLTDAMAVMTGNTKGPMITILMNHPGADAEEVLNVIQDLNIGRLVVFHQRDQALGAAWRKAAQGQLMAVALGRKDPKILIRQVVAAKDKEIMVSLWTQDFGVTDLGIYSILAEIAKIADPKLKDLALTALRYAFLKFATLSADEQQKIIANPELIKNYLEQTGVTKFIQFENGTLTLKIAEFVNDYLTRAAVEQAA